MTKKPATTDDVLDLLDAPSTAAALGAALELGLFWFLDARPLDEAEVAEAFGIPLNRCSYWLQLLHAAGLIERVEGSYRSSPVTRAAVLGTYSQESWALLAEEARDRLPGLLDLPGRLQVAGSAWRAAGLEPPMYLDQMRKDAGRARRFTRMLYELHGPLADRLAGFLDLRGVERLMDLGGGSGVISMALARRYPSLAATVVDIPNVCIAGREIVAENSLEGRITFHAADFLCDALPEGFDMVLECDVNVYPPALFEKVRASLDAGGRFVIVDQFAPARGVAPGARVHWALQGSLVDPDFEFPTAAGVRERLEQAGFQILEERLLPSVPVDCKRMSSGMTVIEASAP
jgi:SAM-dependent methyltransferase